MRCGDSEMVAAYGLRGRGQCRCVSHLEARARAPAGRKLLRAVAPARPEAAGRQSLWPPCSHPGSSPLGS